MVKLSVHRLAKGVCPPNLLWLWFLIVCPPNLLWLWFPDCSPPKFVVVVVPDCSPPKFVVVVVPDCSPPKFVVVPDCLPPKSVVVVIVVFNFIYHYSQPQADSLHSCCMRFWMSDCSSLQHVSEYSPMWGTYSTVLIALLTAAVLTCSVYTMHHAKAHMWGAFVFSCHLPDTCLAKWPGSLTYNCNSMGVTCTVLLKPASF